MAEKAFAPGRIIGALEGLGRYIVFLGQILRSVPKKPLRFAQCLAEIERVGVNSVPIIFLSSAAIGMIFVLQLITFLRTFQAEIGAGAFVAIALAQELAPLITTLMLIAKNGSAMAAELGTMKITEQIDALESMAVDPVHFLVLPKVIACLLAFPVLTLLANVIGVTGAYVIAVLLFGIDSAGYIDYMLRILRPIDVITGLIKATVMGGMTATICCYHGLRTTQGAAGVGDSTTRAVVVSSVSILVADYVLNTIILPFLR